MKARRRDAGREAAQERERIHVHRDSPVSEGALERQPLFASVFPELEVRVARSSLVRVMRTDEALVGEAIMGVATLGGPGGGAGERL
ncbi:hypothetical protein WME76_24770 [Sorangium sp. So ce119]|uniref:hypothetical protein n=1 Tax=Sorangium sp. So ce119 TaxID=3133279 RepID=UPI003F5E0DDA